MSPELFEEFQGDIQIRAFQTLVLGAIATIAQADPSGKTRASLLQLADASVAAATQVVVQGADPSSSEIYASEYLEQMQRLASTLRRLLG